MGQQQLLLIALSVIIVGAAVAVGVNMLQKGSSQSKIDQFYQTATMIGTNFAQEIKKPQSMGGAGGDPSLITPSVLSFPGASGETDGLYISNISETNNASFDIDGDTNDETIDYISVTLQDVNSSYTGTFVALEDGSVIWDASASPDDTPSRPSQSN